MRSKIIVYREVKITVADTYFFEGSDKECKKFAKEVNENPNYDSSFFVESEFLFESEESTETPNTYEII